MFRRLAKTTALRPLREGEIPYSRLLCLIDGRWVHMYEDEYMIYMANKPEYIKTHRRERAWLINHERGNNQKEDCAQCPMFYFIRDDNGEIKCGGCTADMRIRIKTQGVIHDKCPCK